MIKEAKEKLAIVRRVWREFNPVARVKQAWDDLVFLHNEITGKNPPDESSLDWKLDQTVSVDSDYVHEVEDEVLGLVAEQTPYGPVYHLPLDDRTPHYYEKKA